MTIYFSLTHKLTNNIMADCFGKQEITSQNYWTKTTIHTQRLTEADSIHLEASYATILIDYWLILHYKVFSMWMFISLTIKVWQLCNTKTTNKPERLLFIQNAQ